MKIEMIKGHLVAITENMTDETRVIGMWRDIKEGRTTWKTRLEEKAKLKAAK